MWVMPSNILYKAWEALASEMVEAVSMVRARAPEVCSRRSRSRSAAACSPADDCAAFRRSRCCSRPSTVACHRDRAVLAR